MTIDLLPTIAGRIGAELPEHKIDGRDIWPLIAGEPAATSPHEAYFFYWGGQLHAVRSGKWKLHFPHEYRTLNGRPGGTDGRPVRYENATIELSLFDLDADVAESRNVADDHPQIVTELTRLADAMRAELGDRGIQGAGIRPAGRIADRKAP